MALAGGARIALEDGELERALDELIAAFERAPSAAGALDGLGLSAVSTAQALEPLLLGPENEALALRLRVAQDALPPEVWELPVFERESRGRRPSPDAARAARRLRDEGSER